MKERLEQIKHMENKFDVEELVMIRELVQEKLKEVKGNDYYEGTNKILGSILEKLNDSLQEAK